MKKHRHKYKLDKIDALGHNFVCSDCKKWKLKPWEGEQRFVRDLNIPDTHRRKMWLAVK